MEKTSGLQNQIISTATRSSMEIFICKHTDTHQNVFKDRKTYTVQSQKQNMKTVAIFSNGHKVLSSLGRILDIIESANGTTLNGILILKVIILKLLKISFFKVLPLDQRRLGLSRKDVWMELEDQKEGCGKAPLNHIQIHDSAVHFVK